MIKFMSKTIIEEYTYGTREERDRHIKEMEKQGYSDMGQIKINLSNSSNNPEHVYYSRLTKHLNEDVQTLKEIKPF